MGIPELLLQGAIVEGGFDAFDLGVAGIPKYIGSRSVNAFEQEDPYFVFVQREFRSHG